MSPTQIDQSHSTSKGYEYGERGSHHISLGGAHPFKPPTFTNKKDERKHMLEHLAAVFRIFGRKGFDEGEAGHCSIKDPLDPTTFWINPLGIHFSLISVKDLVHLNHNGEILSDGNQSPINTAGFGIHSAIHMARPDINAVCHAHSIHGKAYSAFGKPLEMINQDSCIFYKNQGIYETFGGVALDKNEGIEIAEAAGPIVKAMILTNHGLLTMGKTIDEAAYLFCLMEKTCQIQLIVDSIDPKIKQKKIIPDEEADYTAFVTNDSDTMYASFQPEYNLQLKLDKGDFLN
ncbi:uncharacterized protein KGF55_004784 [Candida pseudojiufengensis]|uniref:uncharacterized protein n=1 Tax=Candida pseudojiufengensis TaxID=497109 RepID=UPI002224811E|nr:uncharacterized protein KGF55_004784 [Candida pseudojiufengensis]KAI5960061.1 hypothetical protein KGF55_004784 [Candida pseudojiufengensis]